MLILVVRHAEPEWSSDIEDPNNPPLTALGVEQAKIAGQYINILKNMNLTFNTIWHSDLLRSIQTAEIISEQLENTSHLYKQTWLNEVTLKDTSGIEEYTKNKAEEQFLSMSLDRWYEGLPGTENFTDHRENLLPNFYNSLQSFGVNKTSENTRNGVETVWDIETEENLIIVGHGGTNSVILTELLDIPFKPWSVLSFGIDHASIATIVSVPVDKHQLFRLHKLNDTHLLTPDKVTR